MQILLDKLKDTTYEKIEQQIEHLHSLSQSETDSEKRTRFLAMRDGAQTLFSILESDFLGQHGIQALLDQCNHEQLLHAKTCIEEKLRAREQEERVTVWICYTSLSATFGFLKQQDASEKLMELMQADAAKGLPNMMYETTLEPRHVPASEVNEYLSEKQSC